MEYKASDGLIDLDRPTAVKIAGAVRQGMRTLFPELVRRYAWSDWVDSTKAGQKPETSFAEYAKQFD